MPLVAAWFIGSVTLWFLTLLWRAILIKLGTTIGHNTATRIWFFSQISRYAPGKLWHFVGRAYLGQQHGIRASVTSLSLFLELLQTIAAGSLIMLASIIIRSWFEGSLWFILLLLPLALLYLWPGSFESIVGRLLLFAKQEPIAFTIKTEDLLGLLLGYGLSWIGYGIGLSLLIGSVYPLPLVDIPIVTGMFAAAWLAGFFSFITPGGLGVRESVLGYFLAMIIPSPQALLIALMARIWMILSELTGAIIFGGIGWFMEKFQH